MDVERYLLSTALSGIISQRLARRLCPHCATLRKTTPFEKNVFKKVLNKDIPEIYEPQKCEHCISGYHGRIAIQEVLLINDEIRDAITNENIEKDDLRVLVYGGTHVTTLLQDGLQKVLAGYTTFEEIYKLIEVENSIDEMEEVEKITKKDRVPQEETLEEKKNSEAE